MYSRHVHHAWGASVCGQGFGVLRIPALCGSAKTVTPLTWPSVDITEGMADCASHTRTTDGHVKGPQRPVKVERSLPRNVPKAPTRRPRSCRTNRVTDCASRDFKAARATARQNERDPDGKRLPTPSRRGPLMP